MNSIDTHMTVEMFPAIGIPAPPELLVLLLIVILLFGANKIPQLARSSGEAIGEFQKGRQEVEKEIEQMKEGPTTEDDETERDDVEAEVEDATKEQ